MGRSWGGEGDVWIDVGGGVSMHRSGGRGLYG